MFSFLSRWILLPFAFPLYSFAAVDLIGSENTHDCLSDNGSRVCIVVESLGSSLIFKAQNRERYPITLDFDLPVKKNLALLQPLVRTHVIQPQDAVNVAELEIPGEGRWEYEYKYSFQLGDKNADGTDFVYRLPFVHGKPVMVSQGYNGSFSHQNSNSLDFLLREGTPIYAIRKGIVAELRESETRACSSAAACKENYVSIVHLDGTVAEYLHLQLNGVRVEIGDVVDAGDPIALSGNTGFSTTPHLHLHIARPIDGRASFRIPTRFYTARGIVSEIKQNMTYEASSVENDQFQRESAIGFPCPDLDWRTSDCQ